MIYHNKLNDGEMMSDGEAQQLMRKNRQAVQNAGGTIDVSRGFSIQSARLVLELPEGVQPSSVFPDVEWVEAPHDTH